MQHPSVSDYFDTPVALTEAEFAADVGKHLDWLALHPLVIKSGTDQVRVLCDAEQVATFAVEAVRSVGAYVLTKLPKEAP